MELSDTSVDAYLAGIEDAEVAETLATLDEKLSATMPDRRRVLYEGTFWGGSEQTIIGYGHLVQSRPKGDDVHWFLVGLARQKSHYSVYVNAVLDGKYLGQHHAGRLGRVKLGSASIGFKSIDDLELQPFLEMIRQADQITDPDPR